MGRYYVLFAYFIAFIIFDENNCSVVCTKVCLGNLILLSIHSFLLLALIVQIADPSGRAV
jgi:hypothetical protein